jgi:hypothetical protein
LLTVGAGDVTAQGAALLEALSVRPSAPEAHHGS